MPIVPATPYPKAPGQQVRSGDWNQVVDEVIRLDNQKLNLTGGTISGPLSVTENLGVGTVNASHKLSVAATGAALSVSLNAVIDGDGQKYGVFSTAGGADGAAKYGVYGAATSTGTGNKSGVYGFASGNTGDKYGGQFSATGDDGTKNGLYASASGSAGAKYGLRTYSSGDEGTKYGLYAQASGNADSKIGALAFAFGDDGNKFGLTASASGNAGEKYGGQFSAIGDGGNKFGVFVNANGSAGNKVGLRASASGDDGNKWGLDIQAIGNAGTKFGAQISASGDTGTKYGLYATVSGSAGTKYGLQAFVSGDDGTKYGLYVQASGNADDKLGAQISALGDDGNKFGVNASASGSAGNKYALRGGASGDGGNKYGVVAFATGNGGGKYGVYGSASGTGTNYAGYFVGNVHITGTLSKGGGSFLIDHPLDPLNRTLRHNFVESPEYLCLYRGQVRLEDGEAVVTMPDYFAALTKEEEATVILTAIRRTRSARDARLAARLAAGSARRRPPVRVNASDTDQEEPFSLEYEWNSEHTAFTIYGEGVEEVSWLVIADRDDPVRHLLAEPAEEEKVGPARGKYLYPEAYGESRQMGIDAEIESQVQGPRADEEELAQPEILEPEVMMPEMPRPEVMMPEMPKPEDL